MSIGRGPIDEAAFDALLSPLGPWPHPHDPGDAPVAVAVSGGADSLCLAWLVARWAGRRGLTTLGLVVDHGLRRESAAEARLTCERLARFGVGSRVLVLQGLAAGPGIAERARAARYTALHDACRSAGAVDLLLGHHAGDQAETVLMRRRAGSGQEGMAGMALLSETADLRLLRPLLDVPPDRLRATLDSAGIGWVEDPSNRDRRSERARVRDELLEAPERADVLLADARRFGVARMAAARTVSGGLAAAAALRCEGFALLPPELLLPDALSALIRTVGGRPYRASGAAVAGVIRRGRAASLGGTRLLPAGRYGPGWLLVREADAIAGACAAAIGVCWDGRFVLDGPEPPPAGLEIGALGADRPPDRAGSGFPAAVLETLPALRRDGVLVAVPHLGWSVGGTGPFALTFRPMLPASEAMLFTLG